MPRRGGGAWGGGGAARQLVAHSRAKAAVGGWWWCSAGPPQPAGPLCSVCPRHPPPPHPKHLSDGRFGRVAAARPGHCRGEVSAGRGRLSPARSRVCGRQRGAQGMEEGRRRTSPPPPPPPWCDHSLHQCLHQAHAAACWGGGWVGGRTTSAAMLAALRRPFAPTATCSVGSPRRPCTVVGATRHGAYRWGGGDTYCTVLVAGLALRFGLHQKTADAFHPGTFHTQASEKKKCRNWRRRCIVRRCASSAVCWNMTRVSLLGASCPLRTRFPSGHRPPCQTLFTSSSFLLLFSSSVYAP